MACRPLASFGPSPSHTPQSTPDRSQESGQSSGAEAVLTCPLLSPFLRSHVTERPPPSLLPCSPASFFQKRPKTNKQQAKHS